MSFTLYDDPATRLRLLPFTHTRAIADIRTGILTQRERWEHLFGESSATLTEGHFYLLEEESTTGLLVNAAVIGNAAVVQELRTLAEGESLTDTIGIIGARLNGAVQFEALTNALAACKQRPTITPVRRLAAVWDIFSGADAAIREDFALLTAGRSSAIVPESVIAQGADIFLEEGARIGAGTVINATTGPVYLGRNSEVMEGCLLRGPIAVCEGAAIKMGAKIYGATSIGPGCKVGGEVSNVVFFANSNKGHDGFLGNAVIGEWCNLGADTNASNLKNDYSAVKIIDEATGRNTATGLTFCGLLMGDHSKCGINTMFNTGTVVGVSCNIWGSGFPEKFFPSFTWGGPQDGYKEYRLDRALDTARRVLARRSRELSEAEVASLTHVFDSTRPTQG
jgi:UDP-N-acetylglucosamine diphosphorylase/glucosamine-1-phosphate N-acetyltransferase